jgi:hypothetical protein
MPNEGIAPPVYTSTTGQVRVLLGDTDSIPLDPVVAGQGEYMWFSDDEIDAILGLYADNPKRTAARLLITVAGSQALLLKKWSADDLSVDGAAIAEALRKWAAQLQDEADAGDASIDIFEISYPGRNQGILWPEGFPAPFGARVGRAVETLPVYADDLDGLTQDGGILWGE